jgi:hypothetical protein
MKEMKKIFGALAAIILLPFMSTGQLSLNSHFYGNDALKFNRFQPLGSARVLGMGGGFTALGGDLSSTIINPAGLGFYNKSEFSITPLFINQTSSSQYLNQPSNIRSSALNIGQIGVVFSNPGVGTRKKRSAWGISYNTLANFNNDFSYNGSNNRSSLTDHFAERASLRGVSSTVLNDEFNSNTGLAETSTSMMYQAFLIDPDGNGYIASELSTPVIQSGRVSESGNLGQVNLSYGVNFDDRTYVGASVGFRNLNYSQITEHGENFPNGEIFNSFTFGDELFVRGSGLNLSAGAIMKITENVRVGVNVESPTSMRMRESIISSVSIQQKPNTFTTEFPNISTMPNDFNYRMVSPLKGNMGLAIFLPKKLGVVNIEAEYVGFSMMNVKDKNDARWSSDQKRGIQDEFRDVVNLKAGTEIRAGIARFRAGLNYLGNPVRNESNYNTSANLLGSVGAGVRNNKFYADASYSRVISTSAFTPYTLTNASDYSSVAINSTRGIVGISVGTFF